MPDNPTPPTAEQWARQGLIINLTGALLERGWDDAAPIWEALIIAFARETAALALERAIAEMNAHLRMMRDARLGEYATGAGPVEIVRNKLVRLVEAAREGREDV